MKSCAIILRIAASICGLLLATARVAPGQTVLATGVVPGESAPAQILPPPPEWMGSATLRGLLGYSDNVRWSAVERRGRAFAQAEVEAFAWRPARGQWEAKTMLAGEMRRYVSPLPESTGEQRWFARGELAVAPARGVRLAFVPQAFYSDQVYDLSADLGQRFVAKMRVAGIAGLVNARVLLPRGWEFEPVVQRRALDYFDFAEDYAETKTGARLRWRAHPSLAVTAGAHRYRRAYADRVNYTAGGRPLPGTGLAFRQTAWEGGVTGNWIWHGRWSVSPGVEKRENRDRASGFFDYDERRARCELSWEQARWRVEADGSAGRYRYRVQTVGMGLMPPARVREDFAAGVRVEYAVGPRWKWIARAAWERSRTNEVNASYRTHTVSAGAAWSY